ncbi:MAG: SGNH/GDSL hydrolase family protein [Actinobacteria bacterium]|nr:SGNH/GDSL hydrolase family protein [Actinomycetota bacterium]
MSGRRWVWGRSARAVGLTAALAVFAPSCTGGGAAGGIAVGSPVTGKPFVYAAVGASETVGIGTTNPLTDAWPRVLWRTTLPGAIFYDFGVSGSTTADALSQQVGAALAVHPDLVTVWLNVNDLIHGVPVARYQKELGTLIHKLRDGGAVQVLVATTPRLDSLPVYLACRRSEVTCPLPDPSLPPPGVVRAQVRSYNSAITRVAFAEGAIIVDLGSFGDAPATHPEYISGDGFHPSTLGAAAIAVAFAKTIPASTVAEAAG